MASCNDKFCNLCDPTSVRAEEWCSECSDFLCLDCAKHHKVSRVSKSHFVISIKDYEDLPPFVTNLKFYCEEHGDKLDVFCPSHNIACCIRCVLSSHKKCYGIAPLTDLVKNAKSSPQMMEIEHTLNELKTFVERAKCDKETNKIDTKEQQDRIRDEIGLLRKALNDHIDTMENNILKKLNDTAEQIYSDADKVLNELLEIGARIQQLLNECFILKENGSDPQTFLGMPHLVSEITNEEQNIEKMKEDGFFDHRRMVFVDKPDFSQILTSFGDITVDVETNDLSFKVEKEKQAQIIGFITPTCDNLKLKLSKSLNIRCGDTNNIISGCSVSDVGEMFFSEYNQKSYKDRVIMHSCDGSFARCIAGQGKVSVRIKGSIYGVACIDDSNVAFSVENKLYAFNKSTSESTILHINNSKYCTLYGITSCRRNRIAVVGENGIFISNSMEGPLEQIRLEPIEKWSYIASNNDKLFYTSGNDTVKCCNIGGEHLWTFEDTSVLRSPRGVTVDRDGYIYVAGEESENIVVLTPNGKFGKDLQCVTAPRVLSYYETKHQLVVCNSNNDTYLFDILSTL